MCFLYFDNLRHLYLSLFCFVPHKKDWIKYFQPKLSLAEMCTLEMKWDIFRWLESDVSHFIYTLKQQGPIERQT